MMFKKIFLNLLIAIFLFSDTFCKAKGQSIFAPGTAFSLMATILLGLQSRPIFSPESGRFTEAVTVNISNSDKNKGLPIHYTLDGSRASCLSSRYNPSTGVKLELGKIYTINAVECFEGFPSNLGTSGEYILGFCQNYSGVTDGKFLFIKNKSTSYSPSPPPKDTKYKYSISPAPNSCLNFDTNSGTISGNCTTSIAEQEYRITRVLESGSGENFSCLAKIGVSEWQNEAYLKAPNAGGSDVFGTSVSISGDTIVVGAAGEASNQTTITNGTTASADNSSGGSGAAYVFRRTGTTWANEAYIKAPNAGGSDQFGRSISVSGDTIVVGADFEDSSQTTITNGSSAASDNTPDTNANKGAAYVFRRTGTTWANEAYLKASNAEGISPNGDQFGFSVSISGDTIVVGAYNEDSLQTTITNGTLVQGSDVGGTDSGAAYVFRRTGTTWTNEAYLKAPNAEGGDIFGFSVSISGDTIVVGARDEDSDQTTITNGTLISSNNFASKSGATYVFKRTGTTWVNEAYLKAPNTREDVEFGRSVSISGDTIVVGAWIEDSNQTTITNGSTASSNNTAFNSGAAYVFRRTGSTWRNEAYLKPPNAEGSITEGDRFGISVSISGDLIVVGAIWEDSLQTTISNGTLVQASDLSFSNVGAAFVFRRTGTTWANEAYLKAPNAEGGATSPQNNDGDNFGWSVSVSGDTIVVGANWEDSNQTTITNGTLTSSNNSATDSGAAYVYRLR